MTTKAHPTIEDLYNVPDKGKAEVMNGKVVRMSPTGDLPGRAGGIIYASLLEYERRHKSGYAYPDNVGFIVNLPRRRSFSPDAAFYTGKRTGMKFLEGAPVFAVEVRSEKDYGPRAKARLARKRRDYFAAGSLVVWDVDLLSNEVIRVYRANDLTHPTIYRCGETAEAEPAVPGWTLPVDA